MTEKIKVFLNSKFTDPILDIFKFKKAFFLGTSAQVILVIFLWISSIYLGYQEFLTKGTLQDYPPGDAFSLINVPFWEEFIFRGFILTNIWKYKPAIFAVFLSSLLFGLRHYINLFYGSTLEMVTSQFIYTALIFGPIAGFLTIKTRSVWPAVILHFINNLWIIYF